MADPSTVVDMTGRSPKIIRQGKLIVSILIDELPYFIIRLCNVMQQL